MWWACRSAEPSFHFPVTILSSCPVHGFFASSSFRGSLLVFIYAHNDFCIHSYICIHCQFLQNCDNMLLSWNLLASSDNIRGPHSPPIHTKHHPAFAVSAWLLMWVGCKLLFSSSMNEASMSKFSGGSEHPVCALAYPFVTLPWKSWQWGLFWGASAKKGALEMCGLCSLLTCRADFCCVPVGSTLCRDTLKIGPPVSSLSLCWFNCLS